MATHDLDYSFGVSYTCRAGTASLRFHIKLKQWYGYNKVECFATRLFMDDEKETGCERRRWSLLYRVV